MHCRHFLLTCLVVPLLCHCGSSPDPGPTAAQISERLGKLETGTFAGADDKEIAYVVQRPARLNPRRAAFLYLHGIESHGGWFDLAAGQLARRGYPVFSIDRRGSGINRENRHFTSGHVESGVRLVDDVQRAVAAVRASGKFDEIYLIGLSWGGKYVMAYDVAHPNQIDGMVLVTPGMKPKVDLTVPQKAAVFVDMVFAPERQHPVPIETEMFTTDPDQLAYIRNDPLRLHTVSAAFLKESIRMDRMVERSEDREYPPLLLFLAGRDRIIDNEATRELVTRDPQRPVKIVEYPEQTHSIQLDAPDRLARDMIRWIDTLPRKH
ncbi:alpha/beta fold hydrolase [Haloferula sp. A504]|uniref:alpha/beta fold hydrolase n=1 Tax=Haloferula sp. A504 TaxID=3373601 RepID=UPI0031C345CE|nr:lysophospholipase [Verrucomicrobiaceae bacterium E54]